MIAWDQQWPEVSALSFLVIGFVISLLLQSPVLVYLSVIFAGGLAGRVYYLQRYREPLFPFILIILGFLVGYLIGNIWTSRFWTLFFFLSSLGISYYLHVKKIITTFKSVHFLK